MSPMSPQNEPQKRSNLNDINHHVLGNVIKYLGNADVMRLRGGNSLLHDKIEIPPLSAWTCANTEASATEA